MLQPRLATSQNLRATTLRVASCCTVTCSVSCLRLRPGKLRHWRASADLLPPDLSVLEPFVKVVIILMLLKDAYVVKYASWHCSWHVSVASRDSSQASQ